MCSLKTWVLRLSACAVLSSAGLLASPALADEKLTPPPLETKGKPASPPAPHEGAKPRLVGLSLLGGVMDVDLGPMNDRLGRAGYPNKRPAIFPMVGGQGFGLFSHFLIGGSGAGLLPRSTDPERSPRTSRRHRGQKLAWSAQKKLARSALFGDP
jgi:hypothetical protein